MRMLLLGGRIHAAGAPDATAMAVEDGTVVWIGQDGPAKALYPDAEVVQLDGAFVAPAFVDPHVHSTAAGLQLTGLDLTGCTSLVEMLDALRKADGDTVWGHGWDETAWPERRPPTRAEIDAVAGGRLVYLSRIDVHSALVSSATVDRAPDARGADGWDADGPLSRDAHHHARRVALRSLSAEQRQAAKLAFLQHAGSRGVAAVHECAGPEISGKQDLAEVLDLGRSESLPDVVGYWGEIGAVEVARELGVRGLAGDLFVDGAIGSRTAALHEPYADAPTTGARYLDAGDIAEHLITCTNASLQAGFHVIGDAAVAAVVDGFAKAEATVGRDALAAARHRLEHVEMVTAEQADRLASWGVIASMQPMFDAAWGGPDGMYVQRLGERGTSLNPFAMLARSGVVLAFGSDAPVTPVDPWRSVQAAVHHKTPGFGVSARAAFTAHTRGGWRAAGVDDGVTGVLTPGAPATYAVWETGDLVVAGSDSRVQRWSTDPRSGVPGLPALDPGAELPACVRTVLRGKTIYQKG
ncbi:amidohydrolase [Kibdelosporangium persicum]|uniref:Exoenzymes regulatory protein AepA in lipid-linked oligosaccharide synthesis cluster n=1 Tax=Kibdelosporangium persicum TaxID=2698649 RepID=A0ABX2F2A8_9PSEU|nr:amidohydrolase [Kibdelosporangium persicum]NRN65464.1 Exoenzymes regulatory protein AepA in lipid-linked oligosaccharide synthesis cluster [Kibdelosporangium persicum]